MCGNGLCGDRRIRISYYTGRVVYLPDIVWSGHGIGNGEYGGRSSGRSGHGREKAACKACQRCGGRSSTDRGNHGSNCRDDHIYSKAFGKPVYIDIERRTTYGKIRKRIKEVLLAGIGAVAVTGEKSKELLDEMVKKGELTVEQGKALNEELKHNIKSTVKEKVNVKVKTSSPEELDELLDKMTPEQMALLKQRIDEMEKKQEEFEAAETVEDVADESVCEDAAEKAAEEETAENEDI